MTLRLDFYKVLDKVFEKFSTRVKIENLGILLA
jgi:hypothetical protein